MAESRGRKVFDGVERTCGQEESIYSESLRILNALVSMLGEAQVAVTSRTFSPVEASLEVRTWPR